MATVRVQLEHMDTADSIELERPIKMRVTASARGLFPAKDLARPTRWVELEEDEARTSRKVSLEGRLHLLGGRQVDEPISPIEGASLPAGLALDGFPDLRLDNFEH